MLFGDKPCGLTHTKPSRQCIHVSYFV